jgi:hypothetical protein
MKRAAGLQETSRRFPPDDKAALSGTEGSPALEYGCLASFLLRGCLACIASGLWVWQQEFEITTKYAVDAMRTLHVMTFDLGQREQAQRTLIDDIRGYFREVAELGERGSVRLRAELEEIAASVWPVAAGEPHKRYRRRWHAKA